MYVLVRSTYKVLANYRPIAISSIFGKIFETIIKNRLETYFNKYKLLSPQQFGFRSGYGTSQALSAIVNFVADGFDQHIYTSATLLDLHKAFDTMSHDILIGKLECYGVRGLPLELLTSFLTTRSQFVVCGNSVSSLLPCSFGVPQGSVLGPLLFLIFTNDFPHGIGAYQSVLYADDTTLLISGSTRDELESGVPGAESSASEWLIANKLKLNNDKTQRISFFTTNGTEHVGLLGVRIDQSLRWKHHIEFLAAKLSTSLFALRRLRSCLSTVALISAYYSIVHSHLTYAVTLWGNSVHSPIVFRLQKRAIRIIMRFGPRDSCRDAFKQLKILTLPCLFIFYTIIGIHDKADDYVRHSAFHQYNTRFCDNLVSLRSRTRIASLNRPNLNLYNILPSAVKNLPRPKFRSTLRIFLSSHSFYSIEEYRAGVHECLVG